MFKNNKVMGWFVYYVVLIAMSLGVYKMSMKFFEAFIDALGLFD